MGIKDNGN